MTTEEASVDIAAFIAAFFETFKDFKGRSLHLTGESYAVSTYTPMVALSVFYIVLNPGPISPDLWFRDPGLQSRSGF